jgi:hypothetical protein
MSTRRKPEPQPAAPPAEQPVDPLVQVLRDIQQTLAHTNGLLTDVVWLNGGPAAVKQAKDDYNDAQIGKQARAAAAQQAQQ